MKTTSFLLFLLCSNYIFGQALSFEEYFPLKNGVTKVFYVSHISENDTLQDINDSSICKSLVVNEKEIFYFDDKLNNDDDALISSQSFCKGAFYYDKGNFLLSDISWKSELDDENLDYFETLFPSIIYVDTVYQFQKEEEKRKYKFNGFESVSIKNNILKDCLKLTIISEWKTEQNMDIVWFKKDIGVVKWLRSSGRLEEIKQ